MTSLGTWLAQQAPKTSDFWSRLLGIDRVSRDGEVSVTWKHMPEAWVLFLVIIPAVLLGVWLIYRKERKDAGAGPKLVLTALRAALMVLVLLMLMGPVLTVETVKLRKAYVVVLVDESRSMAKADPFQTREEKLKIGRVTRLADGDDEISPSEEAALKGLRRAEIVRRVLENPELGLLDKLEEKLNVAYFTFSSGATARESRAKLLEEYRPENCLGAETALGDAVRAALSSLRGQIIAGVVIFSDGRNNAGMAPKEIAAQCKQRYLPIYTVAAGVPHTPRDIALTELEARDAILANDVMKIAFKVRSQGYEGEAADVGMWAYPVKEQDKDLPLLPRDLDRLIEKSQKVLDHRTTLQGNNQKRAEAFDYSPKIPGEYLLILRVAPRADESTDSNNYLTHRLRVADDKIKVLYVEHPPRYEFRYLRNALIRDTKILCHTWLTSADPGFPQDHTKSDDPLFREPLKEFPPDLKSLLEYDVILFGDVEPGRLGPDAARHIEAFVGEFGGGILFISGSLFNPRSLAGTPLANLLPVVPEEPRDLLAQERVYAQVHGYVVTPDGKNHPITQFKEFRGDRDRNLEHWEDRDRKGDGMMGLRWFQRVRKLKAGASPLVEAAGSTEESSRPPLFVTQHVGRGRVFWSATDETWLWRYLVGDYPWFYPFWQQAMYWAREGKLLGARRYRLSVDKERYTRGEKVQVFANAYDEKFEPKQDEQIDVTVDPPAGERLRFALTRDKTRAGYYEGEFTPGDTGPYKVWAGEEDESTRAHAKFTVYIPDREDEDPTLDEATLKELAAESNGGIYFPIDEAGKLPKAVQKSELQLTETKEDDLWDSPLAYLLFALLITAEWILRKIFRML
jgi:hypothetical protein